MLAPLVPAVRTYLRESLRKKRCHRWPVTCGLFRKADRPQAGRCRGGRPRVVCGIVAARRARSGDVDTPDSLGVDPGLDRLLRAWQPGSRSLRASTAASRLGCPPSMNWIARKLACFHAV